jgi:arabinan endo-1,5-alpha-L-arabinosidase
MAFGAVLDPNLPIHDPSRMVYDNGFWYLYATGTAGIDVKTSPDKVHWSQGTPILGSAASKDYWAPDIWNGKINGRFYLFYSQPTGPFGTKAARIGVIAMESLASTIRTDLGDIVTTSANTDYNTIDPCPYYDAAANRLWLSFGSWFGGIYVMELDPATPTRILSPAVRIAGGGGFGIEASYVHYRNGWFYLFANWDLCCRGGQSTYRIVAGRSRSIYGPYLDKEGVDMRSGGGSVFLGGTAAEIGPGHFGFATNGDSDAFTYHAYVRGSAPGPARLAERNIIWQADGWPRPEFSAPPVADGNYNIRVKISGLGLAVRKESADFNQEGHIEQDALSTNRASLAWKLSSTPEGHYSIQNLATLYNLQTAGGNRNAGDYVRQGPGALPGPADGLFWRLIALADGSHQVQNVRSGRSLDDYNFLTAPLNPMWQWDWLYGENQRFFFDPLPTDATKPALNSAAIVNAASFDGSLAPGALGSLFGSNLASATVADAFDHTAGGFATAAGGATVTVGGRTAPLTYVSPEQINFQIPWSTPVGSPVKVQVTRDGVASNGAMILLSAAAPSAFALADRKAVMSCLGGPVRAGAACTLWGNGFGKKEKSLQDGVPAPLEAVRTAGPCTLTIEGVVAAVQYCGAAPGLAIDQLNFEYPIGVSSDFGEATAILTIGSVAARFAIPAPPR